MTTSKAFSATGSVLDLIYPPRCPVCHRFGQASVCRWCSVQFCAVADPLCSACGMTKIDANIAECLNCQNGPALYLSQARGAYVYEGKLRKSILLFKYGRKRRIGIELGDLMTNYLQTTPYDVSQFHRVVPVPLHPRRLRQRGFNQAKILANQVSVRMGIEFSEPLTRIRYTKHQAGLKRQERAKNVIDAFGMVNSANVTDQTVLLVDDVITSLYTTNECSRMLINAGAKAVYCIAVGRAITW